MIAMAMPVVAMLSFEAILPDAAEFQCLVFGATVAVASAVALCLVRLAEYSNHSGHDDVVAGQVDGWRHATWPGQNAVGSAADCRE